MKRLINVRFLLIALGVLLFSFTTTVNAQGRGGGSRAGRHPAGRIIHPPGGMGSHNIGRPGMGYRGHPGYYKGGFRGGIGWGGYRYLYPRLGFNIGYLPYGYYPFYFGNSLFYFYDGAFYKPYSNGYRVVSPPIGAELKRLPGDATKISLNGDEYFELNGVYYQKTVNKDGKKVYRVVGRDDVLNADQAQAEMPEIGDTVDQLPMGYHTVVIKDNTYYVSPNGVYYEAATDADNKTLYKVVATPEQETDMNQ